MGRFVLFLIVVAAALAGVWFYAPGGKDMLLGAKSSVMGMIGKAEPAAEPVADAVDDAVDATEEVIDDTADAVEEVVEETAEAVDGAAAADPQN
jgi:hypothetical protein